MGVVLVEAREKVPLGGGQPWQRGRLEALLTAHWNRRPRVTSTPRRFCRGAQQLLEVRGSRSPCCLLARFDAFFGREMSEGGRPRRARRPIVRDDEYVGDEVQSAVRRASAAGTFGAAANRGRRDGECERGDARRYSLSSLA